MLSTLPDPNVPKIVYILGAGFSQPAGAPKQAGIMEQIFDMPLVEPTDNKRRDILRDFLKSKLTVSDDYIRKYPLEDLYTPIDRCLADGTAFRGRHHNELIDLREDIGILISQAIKHSIETSGKDKLYVQKFADFVVKKAALRARYADGQTNATDAKAYDPIAVISLNWDILVDNALDRALENKDGAVIDDYGNFGVVDYCCYVSSIDPHERRIRTGLWSLGSRGYNVKLLKIHGSLNWLQCPNCQRIFVGYKKFIPLPGKSEKCRHCERHGHEVVLRGSLVMPTFLKDLSNFQVKLVWQNASVEILEAKELVFIGYSLPYADFEFRQLLSRMVHPTARIRVVLLHGSSYAEEEIRYREFFSGHAPEITGEGTVAYINANMT